jgi:SAM-dependent methyltransferase
MLKLMSDVAQYYDKNTRAFLKHGHGADDLAIHRAVWTGEVRTRSEAIQRVNRFVLEEIDDSIEGSILDIGCGVGGTLFFLESRLKEKSKTPNFQGITISAEQKRIADHLIQGKKSRVYVQQGNAASVTFTKIAIAYGIESFLHIEDKESLLANIKKSCSPGTKLIIIDDFLQYPQSELGKGDKKLVRRFIDGWKAFGLMDSQGMDNLVESFGFKKLNDVVLNPYLELGRPRDHVIHILMKFRFILPMKMPFFENMNGGDALQSLLQKSILQYRLKIYQLA